MSNSPATLIRCMRPKHWTKNLLLFAGLVFNGKFADPALAGYVFLGFIAFCVLSGVVYIINDIRDVEQDRRHPKKKLRPIAAGQITPRAAFFWASALGAIAMAGSFALTPRFGCVALCYFILNILYSISLKHVVVLDIICISLGFVMRAIAGVWIIEAHDPGIEITQWFLLCTFFLALFLAICKRRHEALLLSEEGSRHREVLEHYSTAMLDQMVAVASTATVMSYAVWTAEGKFQDRHMEFTLPFVVYGIFRYLYLVYKRDEGGEPEQLLLTDKPLLAAIVLWMITVVFLLLGSEIPG